MNSGKPDLSGQVVLTGSAIEDAQIGIALGHRLLVVRRVRLGVRQPLVQLAGLQVTWLGQLRALCGVGDNDEVPALRVRAGRRLEGNGNAGLDDRQVDGPGEVQPLADRTRGGEQMVDGCQVHGRSFLWMAA